MRGRFQISAGTIYAPLYSSSSRIEMHFASFLPRLRLFSFRILSSFDVRKNIFKLLLLILRKGILPQGCFFLSLMQSLTCFLVLQSARISAEICISHLVLSGVSQQVLNDHDRNPNINDRDHPVGQSTRVVTA